MHAVTLQYKQQAAACGLTLSVCKLVGASAESLDL